MVLLWKIKVSDTKYRRSPLIQGGLEIPVEVEVQMENSSENQQALSKYQTLVAENYHEPVNGKYVDATPDILKALDCEDELTDFEDEGDEEVDTNTADLDSVVLETLGAILWVPLQRLWRITKLLFAAGVLISTETKRLWNDSTEPWLNDCFGFNMQLRWIWNKQTVIRDRLKWHEQ